MRRLASWGALILGTTLLASSSEAVSASNKCEAAKNKIAGKYAFCRQRAEATAIKAGTPADYSKCDGYFTLKWGMAETSGGGMCPSNGDGAVVHAFITSQSDGLKAALAGGKLPELVVATGQIASYGPGSDGDAIHGASRSYTDNGDGTITDNATRLMWEKKDQSGSVHDAFKTYSWGMNTSPYTMNGTVVTDFLATLNAGTGFAGHTDWRIPTRFELESILDLANSYPAVDPVFNSNCAASCTSATCSCTWSECYWSSSTVAEFPPDFSEAWEVDFRNGGLEEESKIINYPVRAVRSIP